MIRNTVTLLVATTLLAACSAAPKPKTLNGRHRQPINVVAVPAMAGATETAGLTSAPISPPAPHHEPPAPIGATTLPEKADAPQASAQELVRVFRFQFPYGGIALAVPHETGSEMVQLATRARSIHVRGRTDGKTFSAGDEKVALSRAIAARNYLVKSGVDATRISLDYLSGGDYLADNTTAEGRTRNRRVEIELEFFDAAPLAAL